MSYRTYEDYVDSNIEWVNIIPKHWNTIKIKHLIDYYTTGAWGSDKQNDNNDIICIRIADFDYPKRNIKDLNYTIRNIPINNRLLLQPGDLLIEKSGGGEKQPVGRVVLFDKDFKATFSNFISKIKVKNEFDSKYLCYIFNMLYSSRVNTKSIKQTTGLQNLDSYAYFDETIAIANLPEQKQIANYLDKKTATIDATIAKNEELIELLEEKRVALINQVVTKGLNPDVPMKDSGVEWIGEIPEHWEITKVKHELDFLDHKRVPLSAEVRSDMDRIYEYYGASGVIDKVDSYLFDGKYILVGEDGANLLSRSTPLAFIAEGKFWVNNHAHILSPKYSNNIDYYASLLEAADYTPFIEGSAQPKLTADNLKNIILIKPPLFEQNDIATFLNHELSIINQILSKIQNNIILLEEYKTSLIHHVVTGKIDVRGEEI